MQIRIIEGFNQLIGFSDLTELTMLRVPKQASTVKYITITNYRFFGCLPNSNFSPQYTQRDTITLLYFSC